MNLEWMSPEEAGRKWGIKTRRVQSRYPHVKKIHLQVPIISKRILKSYVESVG